MQPDILDEHDSGWPWLRRSRPHLIALIADRTNPSDTDDGPQDAQQHPGAHRAGEHYDNHDKQSSPGSGDMQRHRGRLRDVSAHAVQPGHGSAVAGAAEGFQGVVPGRAENLVELMGKGLRVAGSGGQRP